MQKKLFITLLISLISLSLVTAVFSNHASAQERVCDPPKVIYTDEQDSYDLDIRRTVMNMIITSALDGLDYPTTELETSEKMGCLYYLDQKLQAEGMSLGGIGADCVQTDEDQCAGLINTYRDARLAGSMTLSDLAVDTKSAGSLVGLAHLAENMTYQDAPVSIKYYASRQVENVPFMGTAMAQGILESTVGGVTYAGPFLSLTYDFWKIFRNMAYGAMAIVMIVIGIMIMTRRRLNPQTAVTVQYAIPRIVVALVLITFSYPIGAALASLAWALKFSIDSIVLSPAKENPAFNAFDAAKSVSNLGVVGMLVIMNAFWFIPGVGLAGFALVGIAFIIALIAWVIVVIKILILYLKMLINIIIAPFSFTLGAIPGHDDAIKNWFKKMIAYTLAIFAMSLTMGITKLVAAAFIVKLIETGGPLDIPIVALFAGPPLVAFIFVFGFNEARKMDKKVMEAVMGKPRR